MAGTAPAEPDVALYQLQERCGKHAMQVFQKDYDGGKPMKTGDQMTYFNYQAHYNARLNKCFYLEMGMFVDSKSSSSLFRLYDLLENKEYGSFSTHTSHGVTLIALCETRGVTRRTSGVSLLSNTWRNERRLLRQGVPSAFVIVEGRALLTAEPWSWVIVTFGIDSKLSPGAR
jgi:hypothetical protein